MKRGGIAWRAWKERIFVTLCVGALLIAVVPLFHIVYTAVTIGGQKLTLSFFVQPASGLPYVGTEGGSLNAIAGTSLLLFLGGLIAVPFGVTTGLYLADFGTGSVAGAIRLMCDTLLGVPSVVWGLFGYLFLANPVSHVGLRWGSSALAGGAILGLIMTPIVARVTELSLLDVPRAFRESSVALGATNWQTTRRVALRVAQPGIVTGVLLALTNAIGQTVALLLTNFYTYYMPRWPLWGQGNNVTDIASMIYVYISQPTPLLQAPAEAAVIVLLALVLVLSLTSRALTMVGRRTYGG